jgi:uncharacterized protein (DUF2249 family)
MYEEIGSLTGARENTPTSNHHLVLDLGRLFHDERERALDAFARLSPGNSLEIVTEHPAGKLIADLQVRYGSRFYWWPLERGPRAWRAILAKPALDAPATVATAMAADHMRLQQLWARFEHAAGLCRINSVHRYTAELALGLRRYIDIEEAVLFPLLEAQTQTSIAVITERMRKEHRSIRDIADQFDNLRLVIDCAVIRQAFDHSVEPSALLEQHCRREEATLYSLMSTIMNPAEERELMSLFQEFEI